MYQQFWNTNIQFKDLIKHVFVINTICVFHLSGGHPCRASSPWRTSQHDVTLTFKMLSDRFLNIYHRLRQRFPSQFMVQKSNKASISACARANWLPLLSSVVNMHLKALVKCKFAGYKSANITLRLNYGRQASHSIPKISISARADVKQTCRGQTQMYKAFRRMWNDSILCMSVVNFSAQISNSAL